MNSELKDFTDIQLLTELINRNNQQDTSRHVTYCYPHKTTTIDIGDNYHADIVLDDDAMEELGKDNNEQTY